MTLRPSRDFQVRGHPGKAYEVNRGCAAPGCHAASVHAHHVWSRAHLRGEPYEWVQLPEGTVVGNRIGLCFAHHEDVTGPVGGHMAKLVFEGGVFFWEERTDDTTWTRIGLLNPQPPGAARRESQVAHKEAPETCPTCGKTKRRSEPLPPRKTKTWTLTVPDDAEIGGEILDLWADQIAELLGMDDETSRLRRYHAVAVGFAWLIQNKQAFARDIAEASESLVPG